MRASEIRPCSSARSPGMISKTSTSVALLRNALLKVTAYANLDVLADLDEVNDQCPNGTVSALILLDVLSVFAVFDPL